MERTPPPSPIPPVDGRRKSNSTKPKKISAAASRFVFIPSFRRAMPGGSNDTRSRRPLPNGIASPSHNRTPPRQTLTSSPRSSPPPRLALPPLVVASRTARTSGAQRRFSCFGSPTHRHKPSSPAPRRNSSSCAPRPPIRRPERRIAHAYRPRRSVRFGRSMRPARQWHGRVDRCSTLLARYVGPSVQFLGRGIDGHGNIRAAVAAVHDITFWRGRRPCEVPRAGVPG